MTKEEAIFCEKSYIGETNCTDCKYYGTDTCQSRVSHKMAIKALEQQTDDCVSRQSMLDAITEIDENINMDIYTNEVREIAKKLPPVTPTQSTCKDCKYWKDSDGVYRRGMGAESKCPINNSRVFEGTFYCADFEKRGSKNE